MSDELNAIVSLVSCLTLPSLPHPPPQTFKFVTYVLGSVSLVVRKAGRAQHGFPVLSVF